MEHSQRPLAIDLFTGLHGWSEGLVAEGWEVIGFDLEDMCKQFGQLRPQHVHLVIQDVLTLHGSQFKDAALIVASPPCQEYSYMAMPWSLAKEKQAKILASPSEQKRLTALFDACFRIQREACEAAGKHIPLIVENVRGAQKWVGRSHWNYGSFHLWGDVPALMPITKGAAKAPGHSMNIGEPKWNMHHKECVATVEGIKQGGISGVRNNGKGDRWFQDGAARSSSKSSARKAASAEIAKIPMPLARYIASVYRPID